MKKMKFKIQKRRMTDKRIIYDVFVKRYLKWVNISEGKAVEQFSSAIKAEQFIDVYVKNQVHITIVDDKSL